MMAAVMSNLGVSFGANCYSSLVALILMSHRSSGVWQETYLAICSGRLAVGLLNFSGHLAESYSENLDYKQCLRVLSDIIAGSYQPGNENKALENAISLVANLDHRALPRLQTQDHCRSIQHSIEYFAFRIQSGFAAVSLILRQVNSSSVHAQQHKKLSEGCRAPCLRTLRAFLDMQTFTVIPFRTWTFLQNALTSALLLGIFEGNDDGDVRMLQTSLIDILVHSEEGTVAQDFRRYFGRAVEDLKKMVSGTYQSGRGRTRDGEEDTEM